MIRAVLDTNVLVSAAIRGGSKPDWIVRHGRERFEWLISEYTLREVSAVLRRKKMQTKYGANVTASRQNAFIATIHSLAAFVKSRPPYIDCASTRSM